MVKYTELEEIAKKEFELVVPMISLGIYLTSNQERKIDIDRITRTISAQLCPQEDNLPMYNLTETNWTDLRMIFQSLWIQLGQERVVEPIIKVQASFRRHFVIQKWIRTLNEHNFYGCGF